jgi:hypothetical protein
MGKIYHDQYRYDSTFSYLLAERHARLSGLAYVRNGVITRMGPQLSGLQRLVWQQGLAQPESA